MPVVDYEWAELSQMGPNFGPYVGIDGELCGCELCSSVFIVDFEQVFAH